MKPFLLVWLTTIIICSCKKNATSYIPIEICTDLSENRDTIRQYLIGIWEWVEEKRINQITGETDYLTPKTQGYTWKLGLTADSLATFFVNNFPDSTFRFRILQEYEITNYPQDTIPVLAFYSVYSGARKQYVPIEICESYLVLNHQLVSSVVGQRVWKRRQ